MELTLQQVLEALAERIGRPAVLEDRFMKLIAYSSHDRALDDVREDSILRRHASSEVKNWLMRFGLSDARRPVRLPANPELHMLPRVCVPVLYKNKTLGYLWFVDPDGTMHPAELDVCIREAAELGEQLHRESVASLFSAARLADAIHALLSDSPLSSEAARSLMDAGYFPTDDGIVAVVIQGAARHRDGAVDIEEPLTRAMAELRRILQRGSTLNVVRRDQCVLLLSCVSHDDPRLAERVDLAMRLTEAALAAAGVPATLVAGVGGRRPALEHAHESFREAQMSADAARLLPGIGETVYWSRLGVHQVVVKLAALDERVPVVHPGLARLFDDADALPLLETLETYLDVAGNAQMTAERLNLHRTSLYYRLQRLEHLADTDLKDGAERLALHLALKVARMTGQYAPRRGSGADGGARPDHAPAVLHP